MKKKSNNLIKDITIKGYEISFDSDKLEYDLKLPRKINNLDIDFTKTNSKVEVEVVGANDLKKNADKVLVIAKSAKNETVYVLNIQRDKKPIFMIATFLLVFATLAFLAFSFAEPINRILIRNSISAPKIQIDNDGWEQKKLIKIEEDSTSNRTTISHYEYCITKEKSTKNCDWKETRTKNIWVTDNGKNYVYFRAVDENDIKGKVSDPIEVLIDNEIPVLVKLELELKNKDLNIIFEAEDRLSGIKGYYYSLDGKNYVSDDTTHIFKNIDVDKITIYLKAVDNAGNTLAIKLDNEAIKKLIDYKNEQSNEEGNKNEGGNKEEEKPTPPFIPIINLNNVPPIIKYGDSYKLPSYYKIDDNGKVTCKSAGVELTNTNQLGAGKHNLECIATTSQGLSVTVNKAVEVEVDTTSEELWDGYIVLNLFYPRESINRQWRLGKDNEIRTGYENDGWQDYTGPIIVKIEDVENIYIKYDINGITHIIPPTGKALVDIKPDKYSILANEKTKVTITYDKDATLKEYKVGTNSWQSYTGEFEVGINTIVEARVQKKENIYDSNGDIIGTKIVTGTDAIFISEYIPEGQTGQGSNGAGGGGQGGTGDYGENPLPGGGSVSTPKDDTKPETYLAGPNISVSPNSLTNQKVEVTINTDKEARTIYYSTGGKYQIYTDKFEVTKNTTIKAYYIDEVTGQTSDVTYYRVDNIKNGNKPYIKITATPDPYLIDNTDKVTVEIDCSDCKKLEYSFDGIYYQEYDQKLVLTYSTTVYAKATNDNGVTYEYLTVNNLGIPPVRDSLSISIFANPVSNTPIDKTQVSIIYDAKATTKLYKLGSNGEWQTYNGPFELDKNTTVYAYATSSNAIGHKSKQINFLLDGLTAPIIKANIEKTPTYEVEISIDYDDNSTINKYSINGGDYQDYIETFTVEENSFIEAYSEDSKGNVERSYYHINNIIDKPLIVTFEKDMYYLIKLNYPKGVSAKEYKWTKDGTWKDYKEDGILLIKPEYAKDLISNNKIIVKIENENGQLIDFKGDYYVLTMPANQISENLYMRWDMDKPIAPTIFQVDEEYAKSAEIIITYPKNATLKEYKVLHNDGTSSGWLKYTSKLEITKNATVFARYHYIDEVMSEEAEHLVSNIDVEAPTINKTEIIEVTTKSLKIEATASDNMSGVKAYYYKLDDGKYIKSNQNTHLFNNLKTNKSYTITVKVEDSVGNISEEKTVIGTTNELLKPTVKIEPNNDSWSSSKTITITHPVSDITIEYSLDNGKTWKTYEDSISLNEATKIIIRANDSENISDVVIIDNLKIDSTKPIISNVSISPRTSRLIATVEATDNESAIIRYHFSKDGINFTPVTTSDYTFDKLLNKTKYKLYIKVENEAGLFSDVYEIEETTKDLTAPAYSLDPDSDTWAYSKTLTIEYPEETDGSYQKQFSTNGGTTWENYTAPIIITSENAVVIARVVDGPNTVNASSLTISKIDRTIPAMSLSEIPDTFEEGQSYAIPTSITVDNSKSGGTVSCKVNDTVVENTDVLTVGEHEIFCLLTTGAGNSTTASKTVTVTPRTTFIVDSILQGLEELDLPTGYYKFEVNKVIYRIHLYTFNEDQVWNANVTLGDISDVATSAEYAQSMVAVKINGDLTIAPGVKVTTVGNAYGGPKGLTLYVTGKLLNNGEISMTARGAKALGQDVYLYKNEDETYEFVPSAGAAAAAAGSNRRTGGGGVYGAAGTSYSGGSGGANSSSYATANGGAGGAGRKSYATDVRGGGAGNPGGVGQNGYSGADGTKNGTNGTGGLLTIYANEYENNGSITSNGSNGGGSDGGGSGGGSVNIFINNKVLVKGLGITLEERYNSLLNTVTAKGGTVSGGSGSITAGKIIDGQFLDLRTAIQIAEAEYIESISISGDSIFHILEENELETGYYIFKVNGINYQIHLYNYDGDQTWSENKTFGDAVDAGTASRNAQTMAVVKVNGNLTINSGTTVTSYGTAYGGTKGLMLYVSGKLENNGTITMTARGAKAVGENIYLYKNADESYEFVPAAGAAASTAGTNRRTGGGGSASSGAGATGTSYSGGSGGANKAAAAANGGAGGSAVASYATDVIGGGAGNPAGTGKNGYSGVDGTKNGTNGTGGLLVVYAKDYENKGTVTANGSNGGHTNGGGSGGGSVNIFYGNELVQGTATVNGGTINGGKGSLTYTQIEFAPQVLRMVAKTISTPKISINTLNYTEEKEISILYPEGNYTYEYSIDGGNSWREYKNSVIIDEETTIIARTLKDGEVITSSTFTVTTIDTTEPSVTLDIPNEITAGENYPLPTRYSVNEQKSGGNAVCKINENIVYNTESLTAGDYSIECIVTTGAGKKQSIIKQLRVNES